MKTAFSQIIAGTMNWGIWDKHLSTTEMANLIHVCLENKISTFDHADIYGDYQNEEIFGNALRRSASVRHDIQIVTKCTIQNVSKRRPSTWIKHYDSSLKHIIGSVENSLKMLGTDHIDVLLLHRPDPLMEPTEIAQAFTQLKEQGKVLHFGVSNFTPWQYEMLLSYLPMPLVTNQVQVSLSHQQQLFNGTIDSLMKHRVAPMAWSPLGGGKLVSDPPPFLANQAKKHDATPVQVAIAWLLRHPSRMFPVIGTTKPERLEESANAMKISLDPQDWVDLWIGIQRHPIP